MKSWKRAIGNGEIKIEFDAIVVFFCFSIKNG